MKKRNGFTLVEIMLVVAILGLLVSVAVPRFTGRTEEARKSTANLQVENISMALDAFEFDCGRFPTTQEGLDALRQSPTSSLNWKGPYLKKSLPLDPWKRPYVYVAPGSAGRDFDLFSSGPNRKEGDDDDIGNTKA